MYLKGIYQSDLQALVQLVQQWRSPDVKGWNPELFSPSAWVSELTLSLHRNPEKVSSNASKGNVSAIG